MIQQILIGVVLLLSCAWSLANPFVAMVTLMGVNMVQPGELYPIYNALHVERVVALLALTMLFARGYRFVFPRVTKWVLYFFAACVASIPFGFWIGNSISAAEDFAKIIVIHLLYVSLVTTRKRMRIVLVAFSTLVGYLAVTSLIMYVQGQFDYTMHVDRIVGLTNASNNPDSLGLTMATGMPLMFLLTLKSSRLGMRLLMWGLIALALLTLLLTGSRGSLLTLVLILGLAVLMSRRRVPLLAAVVVLGVGIWMALPAQYQARYVSVDNLKHDESYQNRLLSWQGGWHMFLHNPLTGIGMGDYTFANGSLYFPGPRKIWINAHSLYFQLLGEQGLCGVITFAGFVVVMFQANRRLRRQLENIAARAAAGDPGAEPVPEWLRLLPTTCSLAVIGLLYCGYAYHDAYRSTWYFLAAITGALDLMVGKELARTAGRADAGAPALPAAGVAAAPAALATNWSEAAAEEVAW